MKLSKLVNILNPDDKYVLHICNCDKEQFTSRTYLMLRDMLKDYDYTQYWRKYKVYSLRDNHIYVWHPNIHIKARQCFTVKDTDTKVNNE